MNDPDSLSDPDFRATIAGDRVTLVAWHRGLMGPWGPCNTHLRARDRAGVGIADLTVIREPGTALELIVKFLSGGHRADVRDALVGWAASLGYGRIWLPDEVVDLDDTQLAAGAVARTRCQACRTRWEDGDQDFWLSVRRWGVFPMACPLCGGDLPQWEVLCTSDDQCTAETGTL
jgi:hypothetical protein